MKGYRFKLESALRVRALQEEAARARLSHARAELDQARADTSRRGGLLNRARRSSGSEESDTRDWQIERDRMERLASALKASQLAEAHAFDTAQRSHDEWSAAASKMRMLERLDESDRERWRSENFKREQEELDDLSAGREAIRRSRSRR